MNDKIEYRVAASYQLLSETPGYLWADETFQKAKEDGLIENFEILGVHPMIHGLELIQFTIDIGITPGGILEHDFLETKLMLSMLVDEIVQDTDSEVQTFYPVPERQPTHIVAEEPSLTWIDQPVEIIERFEFVKPSLPDLVFEEHRYTEDKDDPENRPDGWVFTRLHPKEFGSEDPFRTDGETDYMRIVDGWMRTPPAERYRQELIDAGYRKVEWNEVPGVVFAYNASRVVPLEWQDDLEFIKEMSWVWIKGEFPKWNSASGYRSRCEYP